MAGGKFAVGLGDVSGKGLPAALLMSNLQATLRGQMVATDNAAVCVARSNNLLFDSTSPEKFVTLFFGVLDPESHTFNYANAGHDYPYIFENNSKPHRLDEGELVLSVMRDVSYEQRTVTFGPGNVLVIYSDGVTEAQNEKLEQFGVERLIETVMGSRERSSADIIDAIIKAATRFAGSQPQYDDMTLVVVRRTA